MFIYCSSSKYKIKFHILGIPVGPSLDSRVYNGQNMAVNSSSFLELKRH
jgi:hypothetical protein